MPVRRRTAQWCIASATLYVALAEGFSAIPIPNPIPKICSGVSKRCANALLELNASIPMAVAYDEYIQANSNCTREAVAPCYAGLHINQGDCTVNCHNGVTEFSNTCRELGGDTHKLYAEVGFDGALFTVYSDVCVPTLCNGSDIHALDECVENDICEPIEALVPTCQISLDEIPAPWDAFVTFLVLVAAAVVMLLAVCIACGRSDRREITPQGFGLEVQEDSSAEVAASQADTGIDPESQAGASQQKPVLRLNKPLTDALQLLQNRHAEAQRNMGGSEVSFASSLVFRNLYYKKKSNLELKGVSGNLRNGSMVCVIGAPDSGAGTLLQVISGRQRGGKIFGELLVDGMPPDRKFNRKVAYIPKEDINLPMLTVKETLMFALNLRLPIAKVSVADKELRLQAALELLGLTHAANTIVGDALTRGISGGERRRVSIAVEVICGHRIVIADSPTNGLDSAAALSLIRTARVMTELDVGIDSFMASIRQPSPELLDLFDTCCIMSHGRCIYWGPTAQACDYFLNSGFRKPASKSIPDFLEELSGNPWDFMDETGILLQAGMESDKQDTVETGSRDLSGNPRAVHMGMAGPKPGRNGPVPKTIEEDHKAAVTQNLQTLFRESVHYRNLGMEIWEQMSDHALEEEDEARPMRRWCCCSVPRIFLNDDGVPVICGDRFPNGILVQLRFILRRQFRILVRSPTPKTKMGRSIFLALLLGSMFFQLNEQQTAALNRFGLLFISLSAIAMGSAGSIPELFSQRRVFYLQRTAGYFSALPFQSTMFLLELFVVIVEMLIYTAILYSMTGLSDGIISEKFLFMWATLIIFSMVCWTISALGVFALPTQSVAQSCVQLLNAMMLLFSGYLTPWDKIPAGWSWMYSVSTIARPFRALAVNEFKGQTFNCSASDLIPPIDDPLLNVSPPFGYNSYLYQECALSSGSRGLMEYSFSVDDDVWSLFYVQIGYLVGLQVVLLCVFQFVDFSDESGSNAVDHSGASNASEEPRSRRARSATPQSPGAAPAGDLRTGADDKTQPLLQFIGGAAGDGEDIGTTGSAPTALEFRDLCYSVTIPAEKACGKSTQRQLLTNITGFARPGCMTALMGPSGAGKSTLLDVLANKKTGGKVEGAILVNGNARNEKTFPRISGYVEQSDSHYPTNTVREAVLFSAMLRLPTRMTTAQKKRRTDIVLEQLLLTPFADDLIGDDVMPGVSPEVRKKVTIAVELVMDPSVLFLDEPTTGLDSASAFAVASTVRRTCSSKAVLCTIHQPSMEIFELFDWIMLLQAGGRVAYFGPVSKMIEYFSGIGYEPYVVGTNSSDYALTCAVSTVAVNGQDLNAAELFETSSWRSEVLAQTPSNDEDAENRALAARSNDELKPYAASFCTQLGHVMRVQWLYKTRDTNDLRTRIATYVCFGLLVGSMFWQLDNGQSAASGRVSVLFLAAVFCGMVSVSIIPKIVGSRATVFRETTSNTYQKLPYYFAVLFADIPFQAICAALFVIPFYFMAGFRLWTPFLNFCVCFFAVQLVAHAFSQLLAFTAPNTDSATILTMLANSVFTLFCGFMLPYDSIPIYWKWMYYLSLYRYPLGFLVSNEMLGEEFNCNTTQNLPAQHSEPAADVNGPSVAGGAFPIFVGGSSPDAPPFPWGPLTDNWLNQFSDTCKPTNINGPLYHPTDSRDASCWRMYCPITDGALTTCGTTNIALPALRTCSCQTLTSRFLLACAGEFIVDRFNFPKTTEEMFVLALSRAAFAPSHLTSLPLRACVHSYHICVT